MKKTAIPPDMAAFLAGGGEMGALMRAFDWSATALGSPKDWPQSLRVAVSIMLNSRYPIALYWGRELALLYNDSWSPIPGAKHPWALGRPGREVWPEIWETIGPLYAHVFSTGEGVWQEDQLLPMVRHGYVEECYFNFTFSPVRGDDGQIDGIFNAVVETTDRVLSERRLRTLSRMGETTAPTSSIGAACGWAVGILAQNAADIPFALVYISDGPQVRLVASERLGPSSLLAPLVATLESNTDSLWPFGAVKLSGETAVTTLPDSNLRGPVWPEPITHASVTPIKSPTGAEPVGFLVCGVNPRRALDASYRSFLDVAAGHAASAIAAARSYSEERERANALAQIDRAKTTFFSNVSHEFRTPLTLMLGPLEDALMLAGEVPPQMRELLEVAHRNALRLLRLVNTLLDFSRIEAGRLQAKYRPTDLAALTVDLASSFRSAMDKAGLTFTVDAPTLSEHVYVDRTMWETIVLNLLSNAFKFTLQGGVSLTLRQQGAVVELTIRDTGTGIPAKELPHLFDRFHRVEGAKGRSFEGSGIGLALVKELVAQHQGDIAVESQVGQGSAFIVRLKSGREHLPAESVDLSSDGAPATRSDAFVQEALRWLPSESATRPATLSTVMAEPGEITNVRQRIILADDNADLRTYIQRLLEERGYEVQALSSGDQALIAIRAAKPDLLVTDVMMPGLDGFGLLKAIRGDAGLRDLPVIFLSARAGEEAKVEGLEAGADDYLVKPFSTRELLARVATNIAMARVRRDAAEKVAASEARAARVLAQMTEGYVLLDDEFCVVEINDEGIRLDGRRREDLIGRSHWDVWPGSEDAPQGRLYKRVANGAAPGSVEVRYEWPDGRSAWIEIDAYCVPDGVAIFYRDVSDRKHAEQALQDLNATLERRVDERTRELLSAEEALRQAQKMEAMGQLTGGVAHDFNNLLTPIVGALDLLQRRNVGGEREQRLIGAAAQSADRAKTLVQRLLAFARRQPLQPTAVDVAKLITDMMDLVASTSGPQIKVAIEVHDNLPCAKADQNQLEMALLNLCVNARDAMPNGGTLRISATKAEIGAGDPLGLAQGSYVQLSVADTGTGMDEATLARATEPFFSTKGIGKGTGLGLSMVHGLASQLGGAMKIRSQPRLGTNVELWIPTSEHTAAPASELESPGTVSKEVGIALLVDDEEFVRLSTADMLAELGYEVVEVSSAEEAMERLQGGLKPNLLVTDHLMAGMNGTDLARAVMSEHPDVRVLIVSGYAESEGIAPDLPRLTKPFREAELAECLAQLD